MREKVDAAPHVIRRDSEQLQGAQQLLEWPVVVGVRFLFSQQPLQALGGVLERLRKCVEEALGRRFSQTAEQSPTIAKLRCRPDCAEVLREGPQASAWFAHHDHEGRLTGFEMRGPDYRGFSAGGDKTLFRLPGRYKPGFHRPSRLVVAEAPIDAMSVATIEDLRGDSLYLAVGGGMGPETLRTLSLLLNDLDNQPGATLVAATDADRAGDNYAVRLEQMSRDAGLPFERLRPPVEGEDWNGMLGQGRGP